jgi:CRISPR-associated protein Csx10
MKVITYQILLEQPLLATQILGDPNSSVSLPYVPGSLLRGMLIHRYLEREKLNEDDDLFSHMECQRLFFSGKVRYLNAYPLGEGNYRSVPTPISLFKRKQDDLSQELELYNNSHKDASDEERREFESDDVTKIIDTPFCRSDFSSEDELYVYELLPNQIAVHVQRERARGRATRNNGAVFQYEAMAAGQWFGGVILVDDDQDTALMEELIKHSDVAWLGRSRSANYGRVRFNNVKLTNNWREMSDTIDSHDSSFTLHCLSDLLLRDRQGQYVATIDNETLSSYLGTEVTIIHERTSTQSTHIGGYNRTWRLPLPQAVALKAGSVIVFTAKSLPKQRITELEWQGLGERCVEGFGRVCFNWNIELKLNAKRGKAFSPTQTTQPALSLAAQRTAQTMLQRLLDQKIDQEIQIYLRNHITNDLGRMPANSQLGRVRVLVRRALNNPKPDIQQLRNNFDQFKDVSKRQFQEARFDKTSFWKWILDLINDVPTNPGQAAIWQKLKIADHNLLNIANQKVELNPSLTYRTALRLIEAVCVALSRRSRYEEVSND